MSEIEMTTEALKAARLLDVTDLNHEFDDGAQAKTDAMDNETTLPEHVPSRSVQERFIVLLDRVLGAYAHRKRFIYWEQKILTKDGRISR